MNVEILEKSMQQWKSSLGTALISSDIVGQDGLCLISYQSNPMVAALFSEIAANGKLNIERANLPSSRFTMIHLKSGNLVILLYADNCDWVSVINQAQVNLGVLINVALPTAMSGLAAAFPKEREL
jgi:predicted regulator of Ras-like GTPase activity (Roadblock/LC7/MglB family)